MWIVILLVLVTEMDYRGERTNCSTVRHGACVWLARTYGRGQREYAGRRSSDGRWRTMHANMQSTSELHVQCCVGSMLLPVSID
jgi:hypothetical protein